MASYCLTRKPDRLKWKAPSENSIDFKLELRFPPSSTNRSNDPTPDYTLKPAFVLLASYGSGRYEFFDLMSVSDEEWDE